MTGRTAAGRKLDDDGKREPPWAMPEWMEPYRQFLDPRAGGNSIERLMNLTGKQTWGNVILAGICCQAEAQVALLHNLRDAGALKTSEEGALRTTKPNERKPTSERVSRPALPSCARRRT